MNHLIKLFLEHPGLALVQLYHHLQDVGPGGAVVARQKVAKLIQNKSSMNENSKDRRNTAEANCPLLLTS